MLFNSFDFLIFFPITYLIYFIIPGKIRWIWLLCASVYFYMCWKAKYILLISFSIFITWIGAMITERLRSKDENRYEKTCKIVLYGVIAVNLAVLFVFKYYNFFVDNLRYIGIGFLPYLKFALPVGISFYTFQAIGYSIDVFRKTVPAEKNLFRYALFVCFFPQLVAGPIERSQNLLPQLQKPTYFDIDNLRKGLLLSAWGMFMKVVIADRLSVFVDGVYADYANAGGALCVLATVLFAFQVYCDFASYSLIALGVAKTFGINLMRNFKFPFCSKSLTEFWDRWHISLSKWFEDYIYQPFVWNSKDRKKAVYTGIVIVFLVSGIWHGAKWTYVIWGLLHAFYRIFGTMTKKKRKRIYKKLGIYDKKKLYGIGRTLTTFALVDFSYIFFRADSLSCAVNIIKTIFLNFNGARLFTGQVLEYGLDVKDFFVAFAALLLLWAVDILRSKADLADEILSLKLPLRWAVCLLLVLSIVVFGVYGPRYSAAPFIYFQF